MFKPKPGDRLRVRAYLRPSKSKPALQKDQVVTFEGYSEQGYAILNGVVFMGLCNTSNFEIVQDE